MTKCYADNMGREILLNEKLKTSYPIELIDILDTMQKGEEYKISALYDKIR